MAVVTAVPVVAGVAAVAVAVVVVVAALAVMAAWRQRLPLHSLFFSVYALPTTEKTRPHLSSRGPGLPVQVSLQDHDLGPEDRISSQGLGCGRGRQCRQDDTKLSVKRT